MQPLEIDIPKRKLGDLTLSVAKTETTCDACGHVIGNRYADYGCMTAHFPDGSRDFCGMGCMASYLDKKDENDGIVHEYTDEEKNDGEGDREATARYISTKKRNHLKSNQFVDEKRRSFPIENCTDVKAAVHAWGRYKGSMSHEEFKSKLSRKAHELGCSLPESWGK